MSPLRARAAGARATTRSTISPAAPVSGAIAAYSSARSSRPASTSASRHRAAGAATRAQGGLQGALRGVLAQPAGERGEDLLAAGRSPSRLRAHRGGVDLETRRASSTASAVAVAVSRHTSGQRDPLGLPAAPVALVPADHALDEHAGVGADQPGEGVEVLAALGVALVRHGDAADRAAVGRLAQLADLRALQLVDLVADPRQGAADHREQRRRTRRPGPARSATRCRGRASPSSAQNRRRSARPLRRRRTGQGADRRRRAGRPASAVRPRAAGRGGGGPRRPTTRP